MNSNRYIRQISLKEFGKESQQKLLGSRVLVIGAGGLGIPVLQYLTSMGVGTIGIVENDIVSLSNLQRQVIYTESDIGEPKIYSVLNRLKDLNSDVNLLPYKTFLTSENALDIIREFDMVVDASDNFPTRYLINDACIILNKPFIYGALHSFEGQVSVFNYRNGPTYRCLFPDEPKANEIPDCNENGVLGIIPGIIGSLQALEIVKIITGIGEVLSGTLLLYDGLSQEIQKMKFELNPENIDIRSLKHDYGFDLCDITDSISAESFSKIFNTEANLNILDVRSPTEFETGQLSGAKNIPFQNPEFFASTLKNITTLNAINYVLCQSGQRSQKAVAILRSEYPTHSFISISGGYNLLTVELGMLEKNHST